MSKNKVAIIGYGYVGKAFARFFEDHYEIKIYDPYYAQTNTKEEVNKCHLAVVCVPTPMKKDGSNDASIVEETIKWLKTPLILIKSTVVPKTTITLSKKYKKPICCSPEYIGEGKYFIPFWKYPHPTEEKYHDFFIIGGPEPERTKITDIFMAVFGPSCRVLKTTAVEAEIIKYMENSWVGTKVTFCNEFYEICKAFGADYQIVREGFLMDSRVERMHTMVRENSRGFSGKCIPKDTNAIVRASEKAGYKPKLLKQMISSNNIFLKKNKKP